MPETKSNVKIVKVDYKCPNCEHGYLRPTGQVYTTYPPMIPHMCNANCGYSQTFTDKSYPFIDYVPIDLPDVEESFTVENLKTQNDYCNCNKPWGVSGMCVVCSKPIQISYK